MADLTVLVTLICSLVSLLGSFLIITSYYIARSKTKPRAAILIRNLALSDFVWFSCVVVESSFWVTRNNVPVVLCYILSPLVNFFRIASLIWTSAISYNVLMSVMKRKWLWKEEETSWQQHKNVYYLALLLLATPLALLNIIAQHSGGNADLGCGSGYEKLGPWWEILLVETIPIFLVFAFNLFVCLRVYNKMSLKSYPHSVRKRRRRIMYHYSIVFVFCWAPTIVYYLLQALQKEIFAYQVFARATLYLSGFFNFVVFGLQDPHLKRSVDFMYTKATDLLCYRDDTAVVLKDHGFEKSVMFEESSLKLSVNKSRPHRFKKLSTQEKQSLYIDRPDLNPLDSLDDPLIDAICETKFEKENNISSFPKHASGVDLVADPKHIEDDSSSDEDDEEDLELKSLANYM